VLLRSGLKLEAALSELSEMNDPAVDHLISFIRASNRGFCHSSND
jgi:hypothetical protein